MPNEKTSLILPKLLKGVTLGNSTSLIFGFLVCQRDGSLDEFSGSYSAEEIKASGMSRAQQVCGHRGDGCRLQRHCSAPGTVLGTEYFSASIQKYLSAFYRGGTSPERVSDCPRPPRCGCTPGPVECGHSFLGLVWELRKKSKNDIFHQMKANLTRVKWHDCVL